MKKMFTLSAAILVALSASAEVSVIWSSKPGQFMATGISPNGKYVCGSSSIWNVETGEIMEAYNTNAKVGAVDNTGMAVGSCDDFAISLQFNGDMKYIDGMNFVDLSVARGITADGSIITGSRADTQYHQEPCYWENGTHHPLPYPDKVEGMPDDVVVWGVAAGWPSEDGSVITGNLISSLGDEGFVMWTRNESGEYEFHPLYEGMIEFGYGDNPYFSMASLNISGNGKWIALELQHNGFLDDDWGLYAGRYNVETGELERAGILADYDDAFYHVTGIANDGTVVGFLEQAEMSMYGRTSYIWAPGAKNPEFLSIYCGGNDEIDEMETGVTLVYTNITSDGKYIIGFSMMEGGDLNSFIIDITDVNTGISSVASEDKGIDGIYNLQGARVTGQPTPGIYIVVENGKSKKVVVK